MRDEVFNILKTRQYESYTIRQIHQLVHDINSVLSHGSLTKEEHVTHRKFESFLQKSNVPNIQYYNLLNLSLDSGPQTFKENYDMPIMDDFSDDESQPTKKQKRNNPPVGIFAMPAPIVRANPQKRFFLINNISDENIINTINKFITNISSANRDGETTGEIQLNKLPGAEVETLFLNLKRNNIEVFLINPGKESEQMLLTLPTDGRLQKLVNILNIFSNPGIEIRKNW